MLRNGHVISGQVRETATHYQVKRPTGTVEVPKEQVQRVCASLADAYRYKALRINRLDPQEHLRLAEWCLGVKLRDQAVAEMRAAAELGADTRRLASMIAHFSAGRARPTARAGQGPRSAGGHEAGGPVSAAVDLHPTPQAIKTFTIKVQPLLIRSCGRSGCHAPGSSTRFVLRRPVHVNRRDTLRNLQAALALIAPQEPTNSPLLVKAGLAHGGAVQPPLAPGNDAARRTLSEWVLDVTWSAAEESEAAGPAPAEPSGTSARSTVAASPPATTGQKAGRHDNDPARSKLPRLQQPVSLATPEPTGSRQRPASATAAHRQPARRASKSGLSSRRTPYTPVDPFDPELFNRQFR